MQILSKLAALAILPLAIGAADTGAGRLPRGAVPVSYDISVTPDARAMTFTGHETVVVDVREPMRSLTLNAAELTVTAAGFDGRAATTRVDADAQTLTVTLPAAAHPGQHRLTLAWTGKINRSAAGLFAIDYSNGDGTAARMLATQFEAPDARRFAPLWDEPDFKARFTLTAVAPAGQLAFSNMPAAVTPQADGTQLYRFAQTPVMSSYLLFLGMGDLERRTVMAGRTEIGVITRKGVSQQGDYALAQAQRLLAYYNEYFGQPYPLPKLDMIAGPGSSQFFGAMENWGAIFYFENELLLDPARTSESGRQRIFTVVAHEMAHQWFGDLVTMAWWDDLWLNEGFASWMESKTARDLHPDWSADAEALAGAREGAMGLDATAGTHPIVRHVETPDQISEAFDNITYAKGQSVIGMLEATLGPDRFRAGIRRYMARYKFANTATDQLWTELAAAATGQPVAGIAHDFTLQAGVPLVTVSGVRCAGERTMATVAQGRFGLDQASQAPQSWHVPLVVRTIGGTPARAVVSGPATPVTAAGCGPLVVNSGQASYTRISYDDATHAQLIAAYQRLPVVDRLGLIADDYALAAGGYRDLSRWFAAVEAIAPDANPDEWGFAAQRFGNLIDLYDGTPLAAPLRSKAVARLSPVLARLGYAPRPGEPALESVLREELISFAGENGDPGVAARARQYVATLRSNPAAIPAAIRQPILQAFARNATAPEWAQLLALAQAETSPVGKNRLVALLGTPADAAVARRGFDLLVTDAITAPQKASLLRGMAGVHPDLAFDWAVAHHDLVESWVEESSRAQFVVSLAAGSSDRAMAGKVRSYAERYIPAGSRGPAMKVIAGLDVRRATAERMRAAVAAWAG
ncbi:M1 family metallopeptidase [Sphingomonas sp.]|uniref:M1 family metallopeptidase n=1 Tax=Sphingomonas sp. TaxID=28214 RepID=UPI003CC6D4C0